MIYVNDGKLSIRLYTKPTDIRVSDLLFRTLPQLEEIIPYSQLLRRRIHSEPQCFFQAQTHLYFTSCNVIIQAWEHTSQTTRKKLLTQHTRPTQDKAPLMFITTYSGRNPTSLR